MNAEETLVNLINAVESRTFDCPICGEAIVFVPAHESDDGSESSIPGHFAGSCIDRGDWTHRSFYWNEIEGSSPDLVHPGYRALVNHARERVKLQRQVSAIKSLVFGGDEPAETLDTDEAIMRHCRRAIEQEWGYEDIVEQGQWSAYLIILEPIDGAAIYTVRRDDFGDVVEQRLTDNSFEQTWEKWTELLREWRASDRSAAT